MKTDGLTFKSKPTKSGMPQRSRLSTVVPGSTSAISHPDIIRYGLITVLIPLLAAFGMICGIESNVYRMETSCQITRSTIALWMKSAKDCKGVSHTPSMWANCAPSTEWLGRSPSFPIRSCEGVCDTPLHLFDENELNFFGLSSKGVWSSSYSSGWSETFAMTTWVFLFTSMQRIAQRGHWPAGDIGDEVYD